MFLSRVNVIFMRHIFGLFCMSLDDAEVSMTYSHMPWLMLLAMGHGFLPEANLHLLMLTNVG